MNAIQGWGVVFLALILGAFVAVGVKVKGRWLGILIDSRNKMSLSRFQVALWTLLVGAALAALAVFHRSLVFEVPTEVWALLGISVGSTSGAVIVKGTKDAQRPSRTGRYSGNKSVLARKEEPGQAALSDMFKGEELEDQDYVDIGKVQMFFFTLLAVFGYLVALVSWTSEVPALTASAASAAAALADYAGSDPGRLDALQAAADSTWSAAYRFPELSAQLLTILGISHAGYLTIKAAPKTPTEP